MYAAIAIINCRVYVAWVGRFVPYRTWLGAKYTYRSSCARHTSPTHVFRLYIDSPCHLQPSFVHCSVYRPAERDAEDLYGCVKFYTKVVYSSLL